MSAEDPAEFELPPDEPSRPLAPADFRELESSDVLAELDGTALSYLGRGPRVSDAHAGDWLLMLREGGRYFALEPGSSPGERWLALPLSEARRRQAQSGHLSLLETVAFSEWSPYLLVGEDPFRPATAARIGVRSVPHSYFPTDFFSLSGERIPGLLPSPEDPTSRLVVHMVPGKREVQSPSLSEVGAVQQALERFIETTQPYLRLRKFNSPDIDAVIGAPAAPGRILGEVDWPRLGFGSAKLGTLLVDFKMGTRARADEPSIGRALPELAPISADPRSPMFSPGTKAPEGRTAVSLLTLGGTLEAFGMAVLIVWKGERGPEHVLLSPLSAHEGAKDLSRRAHAGYATGSPRAPVVRVQLSDAEVKVLGREADPKSGGFEKLLSELKGKVERVGDHYEVSLRPDQVERVVRYVQSYGQGGAQDRLKPIYEQLRRLGPSFGLLR